MERSAAYYILKYKIVSRESFEFSSSENVISIPWAHPVYKRFELYHGVLAGGFLIDRERECIRRRETTRGLVNPLAGTGQ